MRLSIWVMALLLVAVFAGSGYSQGLEGNLRGPQWLVCGSQVGFQNLALNISVPTGTVLGQGGVDSLELQLRDANLWVAAVSLSARTGSGIEVFLKSEASIPKTVEVITATTAVSSVSEYAPYRWTGTSLRWWTVDGGAAYALTREWSILGGIRYDRFTLRLADPVDAFGNPVNFRRRLGGVGASGFTQETVSGDLQVNLILPYVGFRTDLGSFSFSAIWSPFASVGVSIPQRLTEYSAGRFVTFPPVQFVTEQFYAFDYSVTGPATLLEGKFEYNLNATSALSAKLWLNGSWLAARSAGNVEAAANILDSVHPAANASLSDSAGATAALGRSILSYGVSALLNF